MTYYMKYDIRIGSYKVNTLKSVSVKRSVEQLSDTATIVLPGTLVNEALEVNDKIKKGDAVSIDLGYDGYMNHEFSGYVKSINTDDSDIRIECEDELYMLDVSIKNNEYNSVGLKQLLFNVISQINPKYRIECDYAFTYSKFTIHNATALDVLKKIQDETKANIYFDGSTLHVHPQYGDGSWSGKLVRYDMSVNVVSANLKYRRASDEKVKVEISIQDKNGNATTSSFGDDGGKVIKKVVQAADQSAANSLAKNEYNLWCYDGYEGDLTGWLIPYCSPTDKVEIKDATKQYKNGVYYVVATEVRFDSSGGRRIVGIGRKV